MVLRARHRRRHPAPPPGAASEAPPREAYGPGAVVASASQGTLRPNPQADLSVGSIFGRAFAAFDLILVAQFVLLHVLTAASAILLAGPLLVGFAHCCLKKIDGEPLEFGDLFRGFDNFGNALLASLLLALGLPFAFLCCLIPGFFLLVKFWHWPYAMADRKGRGGIEALGDAWAISEGRFFDLLALGIVAVCVWIGGFLLFCVGWFFAGPIVYLAGAAAYRQLVPKQSAAAGPRSA